MVLTVIRFVSLGWIALLVALSVPAFAHKEHDKQKATQTATTDVQPRIVSPGAVHEMMEDQAEAMKPPPKTGLARLADWIGRVHPFAVHFPIALFPIAWLALLLARRRGDTIDVIRSLIVVAGAASVGAALLGWINGGLVLSDKDPILAAHRWIGTALGLVGGGIGLWAWRRASSVNSRAMVASLGLITLALLVQGWLGGALVHGADHMNW